MTTDKCFSCERKDVSPLCGICGVGPNGEREHYKRKPITNADRIRAMSDEELAKWIEQLEPNKCPSDDWFDRCETWTCKGCFLNWLKKEANDDKR